MDLFTKRIVSDQKILGGKPIIYGTRISVEFILELMRSGMSFDEILSEYNHLTKLDVEAALLFARKAVAKREVLPLKAIAHARP